MGLTVFCPVTTNFGQLRSVNAAWRPFFRLFFLGDSLKGRETGERVHEGMCHFSVPRVGEASPEKDDKKRSADYCWIFKVLLLHILCL